MGIWVAPADLIATIGVVALMVGAITARVQAGGTRSTGVAGDAVVLVVALVAAIASGIST